MGWRQGRGCRQGGMEAGWDVGRAGWRQGGMEAGRDGGREGWRQGGM